MIARCRAETVTARSASIPAATAKAMPMDRCGRTSAGPLSEVLPLALGAGAMAKVLRIPDKSRVVGVARLPPGGDTS
jgi:hypothetical protein